MDFKVRGARQTPWACGPGGALWHATIHADIVDEDIIEDAKQIVDAAVPQKPNNLFGSHYYSFVTREYLLNLLLFFHKRHGVFPTGQVCIVERWVWDGQLFKRANWWIESWAWRFIPRSRLRAPGYWIEIPPLPATPQTPSGLH